MIMVLKVLVIKSLLVGIGVVVWDIMFYGVKQKTVCDYFWIVEVVGTDHTEIVQHIPTIVHNVHNCTNYQQLYKLCTKVQIIYNCTYYQLIR